MGKPHSLEQRLLYPYIVKPRADKQVSQGSQSLQTFAGNNIAKNINTAGAGAGATLASANSESSTTAAAYNNNNDNNKNTVVYGVDANACDVSSMFSPAIHPTENIIPPLMSNEKVSSSLQLQRWFSLRTTHHGDETMSSGGGKKSLFCYLHLFIIYNLIYYLLFIIY